MGPIRTPAAAGAFYPSDPGELRNAIRAAFLDPRGPGLVPPDSARNPRRLRAILVPHAGYIYSAAIAARAFALVAAERPPNAVLLLGVDHTGAGAPFAVSCRTWETPLGRVLPADALLDRLLGGPIVVDERSHAEEHSLEVELPFLQTVLPGVPMAALTVRYATFDQLRRVAERVTEAVRGEDVLLLASTDFSHYVTAQAAQRLDALALAEIVRRDGAGFYGTVAEHRISMCGIAPTTVLLEALRDEPLTARVLRWGHSGEVEPMARVVGYASVVFESRDPPGR
jgi:hypothetical protein